MKDRTTVDDSLEQVAGEWEFNEAVADQFDSHVRKSIPLYDEVQRRVTKLSDWFLSGDEDEHVYDLGCATGETIESLVQYHGLNTPIEFVGIDIEQPMLEKAREKLGTTDQIELIHADVAEIESFRDASLVLSLFTMSFLSEAERARVISRIHRDLDRGGALIFIEKTIGCSAFFQDVWTQEYWDFKAEQGLEEEAIIGKARTLRGQLRPLRVERYLELLDEAGFNTDDNVDIFFKWFPWTGFIARK